MSATQRHETARRGKAQGLSRALRSRSAEETRRLGEALGRLLAAGDVILLTGELGAGKTALTQGIARGLGVPGVVNSPTFTLLKEYQGRLPLYHFDLYRIEDPTELEELGFAEYFCGDGVSVVEWAERGEPAAEAGLETPWPADALRVRIGTVGPKERTLHVTAEGPRGRALLAELAAAQSESETR
ncbi:MAG TPA: tRNA (adenosine(37)-N6)-threonylcarbamoyltransferase complex ATPase subunit type 1 TsaE [Ktedonobacterales bacterium]|nr:tRNA (adenosine(37)-N6)-threonylcarbamoyltransferase complex ATPase subunit type 1 TsaE [Ktedonobacterales bacterium]